MTRSCWGFWASLAYPTDLRREPAGHARIFAHLGALSRHPMIWVMTGARVRGCGAASPGPSAGRKLPALQPGPLTLSAAPRESWSTWFVALKDAPSGGAAANHPALHVRDRRCPRYGPSSRRAWCSRWHPPDLLETLFHERAGKLDYRCYRSGLASPRRHVDFALRARAPAPTAAREKVKDRGRFRRTSELRLDDLPWCAMSSPEPCGNLRPWQTLRCRRDTLALH